MDEIREETENLAPDTVSEDAPCESDAEASDSTILTPEEELATLAESFPEILASQSPENSVNLGRYSELRALGLTEREAYLATRRTVVREDNRAHLSPAVAREARGHHSAMPEGELRACRELFFGMSDAEIRRLYKKVSV